MLLNRFFSSLFFFFSFCSGSLERGILDSEWPNMTPNPMMFIHQYMHSFRIVRSFWFPLFLFLSAQVWNWFTYANYIMNLKRQTICDWEQCENKKLLPKRNEQKQKGIKRMEWNERTNERTDEWTDEPKMKIKSMLYRYIRTIIMA